MAQGNFTQRVAVPNRDEFGTLSKNLNTVSAQLASVYHKLQTMNANLQHQVHDQLAELERVTVLKRYLSPQLADSIVAGDLAVTRRRGGSSSRCASSTCGGSRQSPSATSPKSWSTCSTPT